MSSFLSQNKYPLFLNFRKFIFMIGDYLKFQFVDRYNSNISSHKLYIDKNKSDIKLNIFNLNEISNKENYDNNFIDDYFLFYLNL